MIQIDTHIPIPKREGTRARRNTRYPWNDMIVGASFVAKGVSRNAIRTTATYHERRLGWEFLVEPEGKNFRVFRVA